MDARCQRHSSNLSAARVHEKGDGLQRVTHDVLGFGVARRLLVQEFHARHTLAFLGCLDAIGQTDQARVDLKWAKQDKAQALPTRCQYVQVQAGAVKEMKKSVVGLA